MKNTRKDKLAKNEVLRLEKKIRYCFNTLTTIWKISSLTRLFVEWEAYGIFANYSTEQLTSLEIFKREGVDLFALCLLARDASEEQAKEWGASEGHEIAEEYALKRAEFLEKKAEEIAEVLNIKRR